MKKIFLLVAVMILGIAGLAGTVFADNSYLEKISSSLYLNPTSYSGFTGRTFNVFVQVNPNVNKVCVISGNLSFSSDALGNPYLESVSAVNGVIAQPLPTSVNPHFYLVIPNCTTTKKDVMKLSIGGYKDGKASIYLDGVVMYGPGGKIVSSLSRNGEYALASKTIVKKQNGLAASLLTQLGMFGGFDTLNIIATVCVLVIACLAIAFFTRKYIKSKK